MHVDIELLFSRHAVLFLFFIDVKTIQVPILQSGWTHESGSVLVSKLFEDKATTFQCILKELIMLRCFFLSFFFF